MNTHNMFLWRPDNNYPSIIIMYALICSTGEGEREYTSLVMSIPVPAYADHKGTEQPDHPHSLISAFVVLCQDSTIHLVALFC